MNIGTIMRRLEELERRVVEFERRSGGQATFVVGAGMVASQPDKEQMAAIKRGPGRPPKEVANVG